jgi:hypothetical protein
MDSARATAIAMTADERAAFLHAQPIFRAATVGPHAGALWITPSPAGTGGPASTSIAGSA